MTRPSPAGEHAGAERHAHVVRAVDVDCRRQGASSSNAAPACGRHGEGGVGEHYVARRTPRTRDRAARFQKHLLFRAHVNGQRKSAEPSLLDGLGGSSTVPGKFVSAARRGRSERGMGLRRTLGCDSRSHSCRCHGWRRCLMTTKGLLTGRGVISYCIPRRSFAPGGCHWAQVVTASKILRRRTRGDRRVAIRLDRP